MGENKDILDGAVSSDDKTTPMRNIMSGTSSLEPRIYDEEGYKRLLESNKGHNRYFQIKNPTIEETIKIIGDLPKPNKNVMYKTLDSINNEEK